MDGTLQECGLSGLDGLRGMDRTVQVLAAHFLLSRVQKSWHHARTCPLNRQGTAATAHPHACLSKGYSSTAPCTPLQHLWATTPTHRQACTHAHTCARTHTHTRKRTRTHIQTQTRAHIHTYTCTRTNTRTHTRANIHTRTHAYACTRCARHVLRQFFSVASDAPTLVIRFLAPFVISCIAI